MTTYDYIAKFIRSTYPHERTRGLLARIFYMTPAQRVQRLNEIFDTNKFWEDTQRENRTRMTQREQPNETAKINE